ncbi:MAG: RidA family protein [Leptospirales bacterium]|jgi:enamine deaminase RidA (YjgF/YER057c/UK114 family)
MLRERLQTLGIEIPPLAPPLASYVPAKRHADVLYISGQLPLLAGNLMMTGPMESGRSLDDAQNAMARCFVNGIAAAGTLVDLNEIKGVLKLGAFVASEPGFADQHKVANGASDLAREIFGDSGIHARFAVGVAALPLNATVELEIHFLV